MQTDGGPPGAVAAAIRQRLGQLSPGERRIAEILLDAGSDLIFATVSEIAARAGSSVSSVARTCQSLGFKGFQDAKIALGRDGRRPVEAMQKDLHAGDSVNHVLDAVIHASADAVTHGAAFVDPDAFRRSTDLLAAAGRVLVLGIGTSAPLAMDSAYRLTTIGIDAEAPGDAHMQHVRASLLSDRDVVIAVSHTGATRETLAAAQAAKDAGARVIAVTSFRISPLADLSDAVLVARGDETAYRVEAMASRIAHLVVLDALFVALALADEERANAALEEVENVIADHRL
jgi:RpiR family transcriptional regulator, carbohydrate utilization regulator